MTPEQQNFYKVAAKRFAASTIFYKVDAVVHLENTNDKFFWSSVLARYCPQKSFHFLGASSAKKRDGSIATGVEGCEQCMKYLPYLSERFFICIDSDLHRLHGDSNLDVAHYVLQTYTYSWENHYVYALRLNEIFSSEVPDKASCFDFEHFLDMFSKATYPLLCGLMPTSSFPLGVLSEKQVRQIISVQYRAGDETDDGLQIINRTLSDINKLPALSNVPADARQSLNALGIDENNAYLFLRGHNIYAMLLSIGNKLCEGTGIDFEDSIQTAPLAFGRYPEIDRIGADIHTMLLP